MKKRDYVYIPLIVLLLLLSFCLYKSKGLLQEQLVALEQDVQFKETLRREYQLLSTAIGESLALDTGLSASALRDSLGQRLLAMRQRQETERDSLQREIQERSRGLYYLSQEKENLEAELRFSQNTLESTASVVRNVYQQADSAQTLLNVFKQRTDSLRNSFDSLACEFELLQLDTLRIQSPKGAIISFYGRLLNGQPNGFGVGFYEQKGYYVGRWAGNKRDGFGKHYYTNGDVYEGYFKEDKREGIGVYSYATGDRYEGEWANDLMQGKGKVFMSDGTKKEGIWEAGKLKERTDKKPKK